MLECKSYLVGKNRVEFNYFYLLWFTDTSNIYTLMSAIINKHIPDLETRVYRRISSLSSLSLVVPIASPNTFYKV